MTTAPTTSAGNELTQAESWSPLNWTRQRLVGLLVGVVVATLYLSAFAFKGYFEIGMETYAGKPTWFKVYWRSDAEGFSEEKSERVRISGGNYQIKLFIGDLDDIRSLRIDPIEYEGKALVRSISIDQRGYDPIRLTTSELAGMTPLAQIDSVRQTANGIEIFTSGKDGNLELRISPRANGTFPWIHPINAVLIVLLCMAISSSVPHLLREHRYVTVGLAVAVVLGTLMASLSATHVHPDERVHVEAVNYYGEHNLPPALDSPAIANSFSDYGKSRLSVYESYYPVAGYFTRLLKPFQLSQLISARLFSVVLLLALMLTAVTLPRFRYFAMPLIVSPQIWYLYSYPNSDMFALTLSLVAAYQFAWHGSFLNRLLTEQRPPWLVPGLALFGVLAGLLLLSKVNFYFFLLFLFCFVFWRQCSGDFSSASRVWVRLLMIGAVGATMYGGRIALDYSANGPDPKATFNAQLEKYAQEEYRPSTPMDEKHFYLYMRERGNSLDVVMTFLNWGASTFATAFGSYGYTQYFATEGYFSVMRNLLLLLLGTIVCYALVRGPARDHGLILIAIGCASLLIAASIWSSWNENFQAQGRYMMPILPMISMIYYQTRDYVNHRVIGAIALVMFAAACYSFVFIGLDQIQKSSLLLRVG